MGTLARVKQHDYGRPLIVDLNYSSSAFNLANDITVATPVVFIMTPEGATTPVVNRVAATVTAANTTTKIVTVRYTWRAPNLPTITGDLETAGTYRGEFEFTLTGGAATGPSGAYITVQVLPDLG